MKILISQSATTLSVASLRAAFEHNTLTGKMVRATLTEDNKLVVLYQYVNTLFDKLSAFTEIAKKIFSKEAESSVRLGPKGNDTLLVIFSLPSAVSGLDGDLTLCNNVKLSIIKLK